MSIPGSANPLLLARSAAEFQIDRSLRFNSADSSYLSFQPASAGNRKTWTWSAWVKRSALTASDYVHLFGYVASGATVYTNFIFKTGADSLQFWGNSGSVTLETSDLLRDPSAWYHLVLAVDTTQATAADRAKIYINGSEAAYAVDNRSSTLSQNADLNVNNTVVHEIGGNPNNSATRYFNGYLAEIHFIDGQALDPTDFGEYDDNNVWQPKKYIGTYKSFDNSQTWSDNITTTGNSGVWHSSYPATNAFNNNDSNYAHANADGSVAAVVTLTLNPAISCSSAVTFLGGVTSNGTGTIAINGGTATAFTTSATNPTAANTATASFTGDVSSIVITKTSTGANGLLVYGFKIDGKRLIDSGVSIASNSFYLKFADNSSNAALGTDSSGNSNTWTVNNLTADAGATGMPVSAAWTGYAGSTWSSTDTWDSLSDATTNFGNNSGTKGYSSITETWFGTKTNWTGAFGASIRGGNGWALKFSSTITITVNPVATSSIIACASTSTAVSAGTSYTSFPATMTGQVFWFQCTGSPSVGLYGSVGDIPDPSGIDSLIDTPTNYEADSGSNGGNYATFNPLSGNTTLANGNLDSTGKSGYNQCLSSIGMSSGKYYCEVTLTDDTGFTGVGIALKGEPGSFLGNTSSGFLYYSADGNKRTSGVNTSYGNSFTTGDVIGIAFDADNGNLYFYKNGVAQNSGTAAFTGLTSGPYFFACDQYNTSNKVAINFGQRPFAYTPPTGYAAGLCTTNLPDPTIADGSTAMDVVTYSGDGTNGRAITGINHSPDFVWIKARNQIDGHNLFDIVRGTTKVLKSNNTNAELTESNSLTAFNSDGFTVGSNASNAQVNQSGFTYVGWVWDGGSSTVSNTDGSITSNVRANASAGFSIVSYTGNGTRGATVGHGLNAVPGLLIVKNRSTTVTSPAWGVKHSGLYSNSGQWMEFESSRAVVVESASAGALFNATNPGSSVFTLGDRNTTNTSGDNYIAYCWAPVEGYSAFGSYVGSQNFPFVYCGFRPRFLLIRPYDLASGWQLYDSERNSFNPADDYLAPNEASAEVNSVNNNQFDFLSNGFVPRGVADSGSNYTGYNFLYAAYAEHPFASNARAR